VAKLTIVRGLPGSGKTTYAETLASTTGANHYEADMFFMRWPTGYTFDSNVLSAAHDWCYSSTVRSLWQGNSVIVSNTFTQYWEIERYAAIPNIVDSVDVELVEVRTQFQSIHSIPESKIEAMRRRWENLPVDFPFPVTIIDGV